MKHFLIVFDRPHRRLEVREFDEAQRDAAFAARLRAEHEHAGDPNTEVVLLSAPSRDMLMRTHGRYFRTLAEMGDRLSRIEAAG